MREGGKNRMKEGGRKGRGDREEERRGEGRRGEESRERPICLSISVFQTVLRQLTSRHISQPFRVS